MEPKNFYFTEEKIKDLIKVIRNNFQNNNTELLYENSISLFEEIENLILEIEKNYAKLKFDSFKQYINSVLLSFTDTKEFIIQRLESRLNQESADNPRYNESIGTDLIMVSSYIIFRKKNISLEEIEDLFYYILAYFLRIIKATLSKLNPKEWPNEDLETHKNFMESFGVKKMMFFKDEKIANKALNILCELKILDSEFNLKEKNYGAFALWMNALKEFKGSLIEDLPDTEYARIINKQFKGLNFFPSYLSKEYTKANKKYSRQIEKAIKELHNLCKQ